VFNAYYIRKTFGETIAKTTGDNAISLAEFWKNYNIGRAVENIQHC
jgi:hypothetical protein